MRWLVVCLLLVGGCRQLLGIDDPSVTNAGDGGPDGSGSGGGHDEDSDMIADLSDNCPSVPNPEQKSVDGKIGETCDPRPQAAGDKVAMFVSFYPAGPVTGLQADSSAMFETDHVRMSGQQFTTMANFVATRVSVDTRLLMFFPPSAAMSVEIGQNKCSVEGCSGSSMVCLIARTPGMTSEIDLTFQVAGVLAMDQTPSELVCHFGAIEVRASGAPQMNKVKVRTISSTVDVNALTIYDVGN